MKGIIFAQSGSTAATPDAHGLTLASRIARQVSEFAFVSAADFAPTIMNASYENSESVMVIDQSLLAPSGGSLSLEAQDTTRTTFFTLNDAMVVNALPQNSSQVISYVTGEGCYGTVGIIASVAALRSASSELRLASLQELSVSLLINILKAGTKFSFSATERSAAQMADATTSLLLRPESVARCLHRIVEELNIEDLFPTYAWSEHQAESGAAAYQTLAALFIRFGDIQSAQECIELSDSLEDSPRALALKGILSLGRGESLGAVAHMISSLQQYEMRKRDEKPHFIKFSPMNIEVINTNLTEGLRALNAADNNKAAVHFAEAVYHFDPFFKQMGMLGGK